MTIDRRTAGCSCKCRKFHMWFAQGCIPFFWIWFWFGAFGRRPRRVFRGVANGTVDVHHGAYRMRFPMIRAQRAPRIRARAAEGSMTGKNQESEFRHPEAAAFLRSLTAAEAAKHPPLVREHDGVITQYWRDGGEVRCREVEAGDEPGSEMEALLAAVESEFGRSLPRLSAARRLARPCSRRTAPSFRPALRGLRRADGAERPGREGVLVAPWADRSRADPIPLPQLPRRLASFGPRAGSGRQERHARGGKHLRQRRQFGQL